MPLVETERGQIWFADHRRDPNRIPSLLIHGAGATHNDWSKELRQMPRLNAIVPDLPGHGKSPQPGRNRISEYAADMIALLDALSIPQVMIAGHSMGGAIAQTMALHSPSRIIGLILFNSGAKLTVNPTILDGILHDPRATAQKLMQWIWAKGTPQEVLDLSVQRMAAIPPEVIHGDYVACDRFDLRDKLDQITVPTLIITGSIDKMTPPPLSEYLADQLPNSELVIVEGGGHMVMLEQAIFVANAVSDWLEKHMP